VTASDQTGLTPELQATFRRFARTAEQVAAHIEQSTPRRENGHRRPRGYADWRPQRKTRDLLGQVEVVLSEYSEHLPLTVRQVFYRLVGGYGYDKTEQAYERLCNHLVRARRARMISFDVLRDDGVSVMDGSWYGEVADFHDHVRREADRYRRDKQSGQDVYVELWCEAVGMMPQLQRVAEGYSVPVFSCGGFASLSAVRLIADRVSARPVPTMLLHVGDYDPSGESIFEAMTDDASAFLEDDMLPGLHHLDAVRVALTAEQVAAYDLPTSPPKASDSRSARWDGETCQAEALPPDLLAALVRKAIEKELDLDLLAEHREAERRERVELLRSLPPGPEAP
jgi:hypothetical protein